MSIIGNPLIIGSGNNSGGGIIAEDIINSTGVTYQLTGGEIEAISITDNGRYTPPSGSTVVGYNPVNVVVESGGDIDDFIAGTISTYSGTVTNMRSYAFAYCSRLQTVSISGDVTIASYAFYYCSSLATVYLSPGVYSIGTYAFRGCRLLTDLYLMRSSVVSFFASTAFSSTPIAGYTTYAGEYGRIHVPASLYDDYRAHNVWGRYYSNRFVSF